MLLFTHKWFIKNGHVRPWFGNKINRRPLDKVPLSDACLSSSKFVISTHGVNSRIYSQKTFSSQIWPLGCYVKILDTGLAWQHDRYCRSETYCNDPYPSLNSSTISIDELGEWCLKGWVEPEAIWVKYIGCPWQPCEWQPPGTVAPNKQWKQKYMRRGRGGLGEKL